MVYIQVMGANPYLVSWFSTGPSGIGRVLLTLPEGSRDSVESVLNAGGFGNHSDTSWATTSVSLSVRRAYDYQCRLRLNFVKEGA